MAKSRTLNDVQGYTIEIVTNRHIRPGQVAVAVNKANFDDIVELFEGGSEGEILCDDVRSAEKNSPDSVIPVQNAEMGH